MSFRRSSVKLNECVSEDTLESCRRRRGSELMEALEEFMRGQKQRLERDLTQRTMDRLRAVKDDVERRRSYKTTTQAETNADPQAREEAGTAAEAQANFEAKDGGEAEVEAEAEDRASSPSSSFSSSSTDSVQFRRDPRAVSLEPTVLPQNFRPLEVLKECDLARIYSEKSYLERRQLFKEAVRKRFGLHVWTWDDLVKLEPRSLSATCFVPPMDIEEKERVDKNIVCTQTLHGIVQQVHKDIEDEEKELELKFLELEVKMNPHVAGVGMYDYQPEVMADLKEAVNYALRVPTPTTTSSEGKLMRNSVPQATMMRASLRKQAKKAASTSDNGGFRDEQRHSKNLRLSHATPTSFQPPQATLRRANIHQSLSEERGLLNKLEIEKKIFRNVKSLPRGECQKSVVFKNMGRRIPVPQNTPQTKSAFGKDPL